MMNFRILFSEGLETRKYYDIIFTLIEKYNHKCIIISNVFGPTYENNPLAIIMNYSSIVVCGSAHINNNYCNRNDAGNYETYNNSIYNSIARLLIRCNKIPLSKYPFSFPMKVKKVIF